MSPRFRLLVGLAAGLLCVRIFAADATPRRDKHGPQDTEAAALHYENPAWRMIWQDEFSGAGAPDSARWTYEKGRVRNKEAQYYTVDRRENARLDGGQLVITARREAWEGAACTSASLTTEGRFGFTYGKVEIRAKIPTGRGTWPALWMLGENFRRVGWPLCGEIDVMENVGFDPDRLHFTVHTKAFNHVRKTAVGRAVPLANPHADYHRYGLIWTPERIEWFLDGKKVHEFANDGQGVEHWPFDAPQYLLINLAIGGDWGGQKGIDDTIFPVEYRIDYVRVWQK